MTRDQFIERFHWRQVVRFVGILNAVAIAPQPYAILMTGNTDAISVPMFALFALIQTIFGIEFFLKKMWALMLSMIRSLALSLTTIGLVFYYR